MREARGHRFQTRPRSRAERALPRSRVALGGLGVALLLLGCSPPDAGSPNGDAGDGSTRQALRAALQEPDAFARAERLAALLARLDGSALAAVQAELEGSVDTLGGVETLLLVRFWARHDPGEATRFALERPPRPLREAAAMPALEAWARVEPEAAVQAIGSVGQPAGVDSTQLALMRGWLEVDQESLVAFIRDLGYGIERQRALGIFARAKLQRHGPQALQTWAEALPDDDAPFKLSAFRRVATTLAWHDVALGVAWCDAHCDGPYESNLRLRVATVWAQQDGRATMEWLADAPDGSERERAQNDAFGRWLARNAEGAGAWMQEQASLGALAEAQNLVALYATYLSRNDEPESALVWVSRIRDAEQREIRLLSVLWEWRFRDAAAAEAWIAQADLPAELQERALEDLPEWERRRRRAARRAGQAPR